MNATLAYAADRSGCLPCKGAVIASDAIGLTLLLAPAVWYQIATAMHQVLSSSVSGARLASLLVPHIIAAPSEMILVLSLIGAAMALFAACSAHALALQGISSRRWTVAIGLGLMCNAAGIVSSICCLLEV
jgi:hypothetical protein